jgi:hypothetical protein
MTAARQCGGDARESVVRLSLYVHLGPPSSESERLTIAILLIGSKIVITMPKEFHIRSLLRESSGATNN